MTSYLVLLRGINVGGKNKVPMAALRTVLEDAGFSNVATYIASGNVFLDSDRTAAKVAATIEAALPKSFKLDAELIRVAVLSKADLEAVIEQRPKGFGDEPAKYHSDAIFLMGIDADEAMAVFSPREGVDEVWPGDGVIYHRRLSAAAHQEPSQPDHGHAGLRVGDDPELADHPCAAGPDGGSGPRRTEPRPPRVYDAWRLGVGGTWARAPSD